MTDSFWYWQDILVSFYEPLWGCAVERNDVAGSRENVGRRTCYVVWSGRVIAVNGTAWLPLILYSVGYTTYINYTRVHMHTHYRFWDQLSFLASKETRVFLELNWVYFWCLYSWFLSLCPYPLPTAGICMCFWGHFFPKFQEVTPYLDECLERLITHGSSHWQCLLWCAEILASSSLG